MNGARNFTILLVVILSLNIYQSALGLSRKCGGKKGKTCKKGEFCAKNQCGIPDDSCKKSGASFVKLYEKNKKQHMKCKLPSKVKKCQYKDSEGYCYPGKCKELPGPDPPTFVQMSQHFYCHELTKQMVSEVSKQKDQEVYTVKKCAWDYVIAFIFACYPGENPAGAAMGAAGDVSQSSQSYG